MGRVAVTLSVSTVGAESADLTRVPPSESIVDSFGNVWKLRDIGNGNKLVERNGGGPLWQAHAIKYVERVVWFWDSGGWHRIIEPGTRVGDGQASEPPPIVTPPPPPPPENRAPQWGSAVLGVEQGVPMAFRLTDFATDADGDQMTFSIASAFDRTRIEAALVAAGFAASGADAFTFDPDTMTLRYDGRSLGIPEPPEGAPDTLVDLPTGLQIAADDGRA